jgi:IPT/TIG domain
MHHSGRPARRRDTLGLALFGFALVALGSALLLAVSPAGAAAAAAAAAAGPAPVVTSVSPSSGFIDSEQAPEPTTSVTISGTNLDGATIVRFGASSAPFDVVSSSEIVATAVGTTAGTVDVTVTTPTATSATSSADRFTFNVPPVPTVPPVVISVTPSNVPGGTADTEVTVTGSNFSYASSAHVGSTSVAVSPVSPSEVLVDVPAEPVGTVLDLTVTGPGGTSAATPVDRITYVTPPPPPPTGGYWEVASDGGIFSFGNAAFYGSMGGTHLNAPVVGMAPTPDGKGYWLVASDGGIFTFGDARFFGSTGAIHLNKPIVAMAPTFDGGGYWLVASDGGIFSFGDAPFLGSMGDTHLNSPIVGMGVSANPLPVAGVHGYWLAAADGTVYPFGAAPSFGSVTGSLSSPVVGIASDPKADGYWLVAANGAVLSFGAAPNEGSAAGLPLNKPMIGMATRYDAEANTFAYWEAASDGGIFTFGNTPFYGSTGGMRLNAPIVGIGATPQPLFPLPAP